MKSIISNLKHIFLTLNIILGTLSGHAQQTPADIADLVNQYQKQLLHEDNELDSIYQKINIQIKEQQNNPANLAIWHNLMAQFLISYYNDHEYEIMYITQLADSIPENILEWDLQTLIGQIVYHFQQSINDETFLLNESIKTYEPLLDSLCSITYRPTLFDFLAYQFIDFLSTTAVKLPIPSTPFVINNAEYWSDHQSFANINIDSPDSLSFSYLTLKTFQLLTRGHLNDKSNKPIIDATIKRLQYLDETASLENRSHLQLATLEKMEKMYNGTSGYEMITYELGQFYMLRANQYDAQLHPDYKDDLVKAVEWFQKTIKANATCLEAINAKIKISDIQQKTVALITNNVLIADQENLIQIQYQNCTKISMRIIAVTEDELNNNNLINVLLKRTPIYENTFTVTDNKNYRKQTGNLLLPALPAGKYKILATTNNFSNNSLNEYAHSTITVSDFITNCRKNDQNLEVFVCDRTNGMPIQGALVTFKSKEKNYPYKTSKVIAQLNTDTNGKATFEMTNEDHDRLDIYVAWRNTEVLAYSNYFYHPENDIEQKYYTTHLFTDRKIYRPGQTVYYKGIVIEHTPCAEDNKRSDHKIADNYLTTITLQDNNRQDICEHTHTTNEYGSFAGSFVIPTSGNTGFFKLLANNGTKYIQVEEYKRPTFEIIVNAPEKEFQIDDNVEISGNVKAYAGYGINHATVNYRIVRKTSFPWWRWWWWRPDNHEQEIGSGTIITDQKGDFTIHFQAIPDLESQHNNPLYNYSIMVDVTDITGETHSGSTSVLVSKNSLLINIDIPEELCTDHTAPFQLNVTNLAGKPQNATIRYKIESLQRPTIFQRTCPQYDLFISDESATRKALPYFDFNQNQHPETWKVLKTILKSEFISDGTQSFSIPNLKDMTEGTYKITFQTSDSKGNEIEKIQYVTIYHPNSKNCPVYKPIWIQNNGKSDYHVGDTVNILIGSYLKDAQILCETISNNKLIQSSWVKFDQNCISLQYTLTEDDLGNVVFHYFTTLNNQQYEESLTLCVQERNSEILFDFLTFRNKTMPGSDEQYCIRLRNEDGEKVAAELLCSMYDASLDALCGENSFFNSLFYKHTPLYTYHLGAQLSSFEMGYSPSKFHQTKCRRYSALAFSFNYFNYYRERDLCFFSVCETKASINNSIDTDYESSIMETDAIGAAIPEVRTNFAETAFFFPQLKTDHEGHVVISFTMPESLTRWHLQGFAHNKQLMTGYFEKFVETSKQLMIVPNAPRFLRENDTLIFSAKVVNTDEAPQSGSVTLSFRNPVDNTPIELIQGSNNATFFVQPGESQEVHFTLVVPKNVGAVTYRIVAHNNSTPAFSDGEEATLPVLTNRILVKEAMQLYISGRGEKTFTLERLKNSFSSANASLTTQSLSMEFTPNPIWYAIQAMPYLMEYPYECNEQMFSRFYANLLATNIINSHPRIKAIFNEWQSSSPEAFCSQLEKNQALKNILLEETPWLLDAQQESIRKQNIAILFDLQRMSRETSEARQKLEDRQNSNGGWSWFAGGPSSPYITEHILAGIGHLNELHVNHDFSSSTINTAVNFMDREMNNDYLQRIKKLDITSHSNIHYLYARSFYINKAIKPQYKEAYLYHYNNCKKNWESQSIYMQGLIALICYRNGDKDLAKQIATYIKSHAQHNEEMGMYWKNSNYNLYWYDAPIERQALLIEVFNTILHDQKSIADMQLWLLKQKQTQSWPTTKSTTEAIYALLLNNTQIEDVNAVTLSVGNWSYNSNDTTLQAEAGTGYIRKDWSGSEVTEDMATVTINKNSNGPAWGGLYWQYLEDLEKITDSQDKELSIEKQLFKVTLNERGEQLTAITDETPIKVGDKVRVRMVIKTDRSMEYVHLKDMRAACFEPVNVLSGYKYQNGLGYYESTRDASTNFFIEFLPKGTYVFEYTLIATMAGSFSNGITTIQCMYAPEFTSHSEGGHVKVR